MDRDAWKDGPAKTPKKAGVKFEVTHDMDAAFKGADIVYPKSWGAFDLMTAAPRPEPRRTRCSQNEQECLKLNAKYKSWICDERRMKLAAKDAEVYALPPRRPRQCEVTDAVIDGPQSVVFPEAENRLHTAKAIMASASCASAPSNKPRRTASPHLPSPPAPPAGSVFGHPIPTPPNSPWLSEANPLSIVYDTVLRPPY
jgi:cell division septation protein DedD